eukprot:SM000007S20976  [mRNA]  locus=s7:1337418:1338669:+ [translate_table: standard]
MSACITGGFLGCTALSPAKAPPCRRARAARLRQAAPASRLRQLPRASAADVMSKRGRTENDKPAAPPGGLKTEMKELAAGGMAVLYGTRIPKDYFVVKGCGETNEGGGIDPWETGSYDLALEDAGIHEFNLVAYTSVIPPEATEISFEKAQKFFHHGACLETIMAQMNGAFGDRITAGVARMHVTRKKDNYHVGGYAAEYKGHANEELACQILTEDLDGIFARRYSEDEYEKSDKEFTIAVKEVNKNYGTVLAGICFVTYLLPIYAEQADN